MLTISEQLLLLALNDEKGSVVMSASTALPYGLAGAILLELALDEKIQFRDNKIKLINKSKTSIDLHNEAINLLKSETKPKSIKHWVQVFARKLVKLQERLASQLVDKKILSKQEKSFLWVINYNHYPTRNDQPEKSIRDHIKQIVLHRRKPSDEDIALICLVKACDLISEVFDKEDRKKAKQRIDEIANKHQVGTAITKTMEEITAAIMTVIIASTVTTTVIS